MQVKHNDELRICNWQHKTSSRRSLAEASRSCARSHLVLPHTTAPAHACAASAGADQASPAGPRPPSTRSKRTPHSAYVSELTAANSSRHATRSTAIVLAPPCSAVLESPNSQIEGRELSEISVVSWKKEKTKEKHQHVAVFLMSHRGTFNKTNLLSNTNQRLSLSSIASSCRRLAVSGRGRSGTDEPGVRGCSLSACICPQRLAPSWSAFPSRGISLSLADTSDCDHSTGYL